MSVDHDGHLSLQFALYQPSLSFLHAEPPPRLFHCNFESMSPISAPGSESSHEIASCSVEFHIVGILPSAGFPDFPRPQIQPPFSDDDKTYVIAKQMSTSDCFCIGVQLFLFHPLRLACNYSYSIFVVGRC